jgi:translation initiation factor 1 (eIF-1/SUI1)
MRAAALTSRSNILIQVESQVDGQSLTILSGFNGWPFRISRLTRAARKMFSQTCQIQEIPDGESILPGIVPLK